jgi:hypothetical protein
MNGDLTIGDLLPYLGILVILAGLVGQWAVNKYKVKELETRRVEDKVDLKNSIEAVNISKSTRFSKMEKDVDKKIQITHDRIDRIRDDVNSTNVKMETKIDKLAEKIEQGNKDLIVTLTEIIKSK